MHVTVSLPGSLDFYGILTTKNRFIPLPVSIKQFDYN
jgi:hypothetical protein